MRIAAFLLAWTLWAVAHGQEATARQQLVPTGTLRVALNYSNRLLAVRPPQGGEPRGVAVDVARALAQRLGVDAVFIGYNDPGAVTDAVGKEWDVAFVAADPDRASAIAFTPAYLEIDATYLVLAGSPVRSVADVDRPGMKIATGARSAYTLFLRRAIKQAELVFLINDAATALQAGSVGAIAGLRFALLESASRIPGARVLPDSFTRAQQAIGVPIANTAALAYLTEFVADMKRAGAVDAAIRKTGLTGASVAP
jgi:polar amino acid transport system substrate-binding protein